MIPDRPRKNGTLTYPGDVERAVVGQFVGPSLDRRIFVATYAEFDPETDRTRVEFDEYRPSGGVL